MFSPPRTYNGGVEGGGSHFQVLLRYSRWLPCHYLGMPLEAAEACLSLLPEPSRAYFPAWLMSECLHHQSSRRRKQNFVKVNLRVSEWHGAYCWGNAFDGLVKTWGLGLGILVAGMHRYVGLRQSRHTQAAGQPSIGGSIGWARAYYQSPYAITQPSNSQSFHQVWHRIHHLACSMFKMQH